MSQTDIVLAGAIAAFSVDLIVYPLDTIKTRMQSATTTAAISHKGLYQGVGSVILATLPASGAFFITYEQSKKFLGHYASDRYQSVVYSISSGIAEMVSCAILTPAEVIKQNAQVISSTNTATSSSSIAAFQKVTKQPGGIFRGYSALVARNLPFTAMQFPMYEEIRRRIRLHRNTKNPSLWETAWITGLSAGTSGSIAAVITTPIDVLKTKMMVLRGDRKTLGMLETAKEVVKSNSVLGLWRGGALRGIWTFIGSGLYLGFYESSKTWLGRRREEKGHGLID